MTTMLPCRALALVLLVAVFALGCDDSPAGPSVVDSVDVPGGAVQGFDGSPLGSNGSSPFPAPAGGFASSRTGYALGGPVGGDSTGPGPVTNLTARQSGCPTDTPANEAEISWNPPTTGSPAASYAVSHYGSAPPQYIWMPGEAIPASYGPWSAGHCLVERGVTVCTVTYDGLGGDTHRFSVTPRTGPVEVDGVYSEVAVTIGDCSGSTTDPPTVDDIPSPPGEVRTLTAWQVTGTLDVLVSWDTPAAQSGVDAPTSYMLTGDGESATLSAGACAVTAARPDCDYTFEDLDTGSRTFEVAAVNGDGTGTASSARIMVEALPPPGPVQALSAAQRGTTGQVTISWLPSATGSPVTYTVVLDGTDTSSVRASSICSSRCSASYSSLSYGDHTVSVAGVNASGAGSPVELAFTVHQALTAVFSGLPDGHDGGSFSFNLTFSESPELGFRALRDQALSVSVGARVSRVRRQTRGSNKEWVIFIAPTASGTQGSLIINLSATGNCATYGAVCTADGRPLAHAVSAHVPR